jgi:short-subunit dehydrogenase
MSIDSTGTALITDASSAIGAVYPNRFAKRGYDLILVVRNEGRLKDLSARIAADTGRSVDVISDDLNHMANLVE